MKKSVWTTIAVVVLLLASIMPVAAQDAPNPAPDQTPSLFLPGVMNVQPQQAAQPQQDTQGLQSKGSPDAVSSRSADKAEVSAALAGPLRPISVIVVTEGVEADTLAAITGGQVIHRYKHVFEGASLVLPEGQVAALAAAEGVRAVYLDKLEQPNTDASPQWIGAPVAWNALGGQESAGEGIIVGVLDTGIWPEHPSFSDPDPSGKPYSAPPVDDALECVFGNTGYNSNDAPFTCNNKLIGAYSFIDTYKAVVGLLPTEFDSARDDNGHGTHTASTAAGNANVPATLLGVDQGLVSGIAPRAHVIAYRVCGDQGCYQSDSVAAVDEAIKDGVDVINFSISGGNNPYNDIVELAFLNAYDKGVFVAASAGNSGPAAETVAHRGPWVTTVAASSSNRGFETTLILTAGDDRLELTGATVTAGAGPAPVYVPLNDPLCQTTDLGGDPVPAGSIVLCRRGVNARVDKSYNVMLAGGAGMILYNPAIQGLNTDNHYVPSVHIEGPETGSGPAAQLLAFLDAHPDALASWGPASKVEIQGDVTTAFSSRGGPGQSLGVSKPDVTAPGIQILAGHTPLPATPLGGPQGQLFQAIAGTSMSSPHVAGAAAIVKAQHPEWTPGQIKSALMMTAEDEGLTKEDGVTPATPFDVGSGRIDLSVAGWASASISESAADFLALEQHLWDANYPSLYVPTMPGRITVQRTLKNETGTGQNWKTYVEAPADLKITVPNNVNIGANGETTFDITVDASAVPMGEVRHAVLRFRQNQSKEVLHFPITIVRKAGVVSLDKACEPLDVARRATTTCTITMSNSSFDDAVVSLRDVVTPQFKVLAETLTGGATLQGNTVLFNGTLFGAEPPIVTADAVPAGTESPAGYLPLSLFGVAPIAGVGDETLINYTVPPFVYAGQTYSRIAITSNGYAVVGGGTTADLEYSNELPFPDPSQPNNVLAPFWTDLDPSKGGALRVGTLTDGVSTWLVLDWEAVPNFSDAAAVNSFQIWIGVNGVQDITFTYGDVTGGDGLLTVGAENEFGNSGEATYFNGEGTAPNPDEEVLVSAVPGEPGETRVITFQMRAGNKAGAWTNCAEMTTPLVPGTSTSCVSGTIQ